MAEKRIVVANRIINRTNANNLFRKENGGNLVHLDGKRLQRIIYLCYLAWIALGYDDNLLDDDFNAWAAGPNIEKLYDIFHIFYEGGMLPYNYNEEEDTEELTELEHNLINAVVDNTIDISTDEIIKFEQDPNGPWYQIFWLDKNRPIIPKILIESYARMYCDDIINFTGLFEFDQKYGIKK